MGSISAIASPEIKPGLWEITYSTKNPYSNSGENRIRNCIKSTDIKDGMHLTPEDKCDTKNYVTSGNTATWELACNGPVPMTGKGHASFSGETYEGNSDIQVHMGGNVMNVSVTFQGKRIGDCQ